MAKSGYRILESLFHEDGDLYLQKYHERYDSESSFHFSICIGKWPAFLVPTRQLLVLQESVLHNIARFDKILLNSSIREVWLHEALFREIELNCAIENIHASRPALEAAFSNPQDPARPFSGMTCQYAALLSSSSFRFTEHLQKIRLIYDGMLLAGICQEDPDNIPDGSLFRAQAVYYFKGNQKIHCGIWPEKQIERDLQEALTIVHDERMTVLFRAAVFHFLFGYIHPFYDGNGRLCRYLTALFLAEQLGMLCAFELSAALYGRRHKYAQAFKTCEHPLNRGDLTPFVLFFLEALNTCLEHEISRLEQQPGR